MQEYIIQLKAATQGQEINKGVKVNPPEEFKGDWWQLKSYLLQYKAYFNVNPTKFSINEVRVKFATNLFRGETFGWFKYIIKDYLTNPPENQDFDTVNIYLS